VALIPSADVLDALEALTGRRVRVTIGAGHLIGQPAAAFTGDLRGRVDDPAVGGARAVEFVVGDDGYVVVPDTLDEVRRGDAGGITFRARGCLVIVERLEP
jgi:hypothetical protein